MVSVAHRTTAPPSARSTTAPPASTTEVPAGHRDMRAYFAAISLGLLVLAASGAALSWDGAYYLYETLNNQTFFTPQSRYTDIVLEAPVLLMSHLTSNLSVLSLVFGLSYVALPLATLLIAWWFVRAEAPSLFAWVAVGTGLALLPGQFALVSEGQAVMFLFWPIVLAPLIRLRRAQWVALGVLAAAAYFTHPFAIPLFAAAAVVAILAVAFRRDLRRQNGTIAVALALFAIGASSRFIQYRSPYETDQMSLGTLREAFGALAGFPLLALCCATTIGLCLLVVPALIARGTSAGGRVSALRLIELLCVIGAALLLLLWAANPREWMGEIAYRTWSIFVTLPFMVAAVAEALRRSRRARRSLADDWPHRRSLALIVGLVFLAVASVQSAVFAHLTSKLRDAINQTHYACLSTMSLSWIQESPLNHWSTTAHAILLQGRAPRTLVISDGGNCADARFAQGVSVAAWLPPTIHGGWFDLSGLSRRLVAEQQGPGPTGCQYGFGAGWYWTQEQDGARWHWMPHRAQMRVVLAGGRPLVTLRAVVVSKPTPNAIEIVVDGHLRVRAAIPSAGMLKLPIARLTGGAHTFELVSSAIPPGGGPTLGFKDVTLTAGARGHAAECELRP